MKKVVATLLAELAYCRRLSDARRIVSTLEKEHGFTWRAVGDREGNFGTINITSNPGNALVERVTNAIDAVIEREAARALAKARPKRLPANPREAVEEWFHVRAGRLYHLPAVSGKDQKKGLSRQRLAEQILVSVTDSGVKKHPNLEVRDFGIGLTASAVPRTILGLNENNKIDKPYLAGAFGQGGSTALAYSPHGSLIVTRRQPDLLGPGERDLVAVTFIRFNELNPERNKNGRFEYLVTPTNEVPSIELSNFQPGTSCVHLEMQIPQFSQRTTQPTGSLWWLLQNALFDPVLPFTLEERRASMLEEGKKSDPRTISGNFTRLMEDKRDKVEHSHSVDVTVRHEDQEATVKVNYWVLKAPDDGRDIPVVAYVDRYEPVAFTFNGQTHGTEDRRFVKEELRLPYLTDYLIIQIELDHLSGQARRALVTSTREALKKAGLYDELLQEIAAALADDEALGELNEKRKERLLSRHSEAEREKMKQRFARLMEKFRAGIDTTASGKGSSGSGRPPSKAGTRQQLDPLPTKDHPTFIKIGNSQKPIPIRVDRHAILRLESDAPDMYLRDNRQAKLALAFEPEGLLTEVSRSDFVGGRARISLRPTERATPGTNGSLSIFLFTPDEKRFSDKVKFRLLPAEEAETAGSQSRAKVQVPEPIAVYRDEWLRHRWDETSVAKVEDSGSETQIFINVENRHLARLLQTGAYQEIGITRMRNNFLLYTAFYAWTHHVATKEVHGTGLSGKEYEDYKEKELDRVAQTVVFAISSSSQQKEEED
ncbi:MAG: hypothetical protein ACJ8AT_18510 [Hyalangium sp.]|uniref:hypothetical protein n=1 Tax=Hyalangium sp. TaxID=2028555 RepID=UPI00389A9CDD